MRIEGTPARYTDFPGTSGAREAATPVRRVDACRITVTRRTGTGAEVPVRPDPDARLTCDHIARIRERIRSGAYDSMDVIDAVARRVLTAGDLTADQPDRQARLDVLRR